MPSAGGGGAAASTPQPQEVRPLNEAEKKKVLNAIRKLLRNPTCRDLGREALTMFPDQMLRALSDPTLRDGDNWVGRFNRPKN